MRQLDPIWAAILGDLFVNLSAGWYGLVFITPSFASFQSTGGILLLLTYAVFGTVSLLASYKCKQITQEKPYD